jgi:hypothetical protein
VLKGPPLPCSWRRSVDYWFTTRDSVKYYGSRNCISVIWDDHNKRHWSRCSYSTSSILSSFHLWHLRDVLLNCQYDFLLLLFMILSELCSRINFVCHKSRKRELKTRSIYECRCDERLKTKSEKSTRLGYTGLLGELEHLKIRRVNKRDVCECDGWVCVFEVIGVPFSNVSEACS